MRVLERHLTRLVIVDGTNESLISFLLNGRHDSTRHDSTRLEHNQSCLSDLEVSARITRAPALEPALVLVGQARVVVVGLFSFTLPLHCFSLYSSLVLFSSLYFATPIHFSPPLPSRSFPTSLGGSENRMLCWCCLSFRCRIRRDPQRPKKKQQPEFNTRRQEFRSSIVLRKGFVWLTTANVQHIEKKDQEFPAS